MRTNDTDDDQCPIAFQVRSKQHLDEVVRRLRSANALKKGRNVAPHADGSFVVFTKLGAILSLELVSQLESAGATMTHARLGTLLSQAAGGGNVDTPVLRRILQQQSATKQQPCSSQGPPHPSGATLPPQHLFTFGELFAGIGGFRLGLQALGGRCVFASEINTEVLRAYVYNHRPDVSENIVGDITEIAAHALPHFDFLAAGFPCQSFCKVGNRAGLSDERGQLFFEVVRVLNAVRPRGFVLENVDHLTTLDEGRALSTVVAELRQSGYTVAYKVIDAAICVPQHRKRVYFVGWQNQDESMPRDFAETFPWPADDATSWTKTRVRDLLEPADSATVQQCHLTPSQLRSVQAAKTFRTNKSWRIAAVDGFARTLMSSYRHSYNRYSELVELTRDTDDALRFFTPKECAALQGFPSTFDLTAGGQLPLGAGYRLVGNAVVPQVISEVCRPLIRALFGARS